LPPEKVWQKKNDVNTAAMECRSRGYAAACAHIVDGDASNGVLIDRY